MVARAPLQVLLVEDNEDDAFFIVREIRRMGFRVESQRVETPGEMRCALEHDDWDVILSDHVMPRFSSLEALELLRERGVDTPCIIVSGRLSEDDAVALMRGGAADYVNKNELFRLQPTIERVLREASFRQRYRYISELASDYAYALSVQEDGSLTPDWVTDAFQRLSGYSLAELEAAGGWLGLVHPDDRPLASARLTRLLENKADTCEFRILTQAQEERWVRDYSRPVFDKALGRVVRILGASQDITRRKKVELELQGNEARLSALIGNTLDAMWSVDRDYRLIASNAAFQERYFLSTGKRLAVGDSVVAAVSGAQRDLWEGFYKRALSGEHFMTEGEHVWHGQRHFTEASFNPIRSPNGRVDGVAVFSRDISERKEAEARFERLATFRSSLMDFVEETLGRGLDESFYGRLLERAVTVIPGVDIGSILLKDGEGHYRFVAAQGFSLEELKPVYLRSREVIVTPTERRAVVVHDLDGLISTYLDPQRRRLLKAAGPFEKIQATLIVPVYLEQEMVATLNLSTTTRRSFDDEAAEMGEAFAAQVGVVLKRLRLERELTKLAEFRRGLVELIDESLQWGLSEGFYERLLSRAIRVIPGTAGGSLFVREGESYYTVSQAGGKPAALAPLALENLLPNPQQHEVERSGGTEDRAQLSIPVELEGKLVAVFRLEHADEGFEEEALIMAQAFSRQVALLLKRLWLEEELRSRQEELESSNLRLTQLANYDALTGLPNRVLFRERLEEAFTLAERTERCVGLLFLDLDSFKIINDTLGHSIGDKLLQAVSKRLCLCVRDGDTVSRLGGDEFTLILANMDKGEDAAIVAERVLYKLQQPFHFDGQEVYSGVSIGIAVYKSDAKDAETLIKHADTAMYRAKEGGKNQYRFFTSGMNEQVLERSRLEADLRKALERDEIILHYQPRVELLSGRITSVEALARWQHPERGFVPPAVFIPVAEDSGLIRPLGRHVLRLACLEAKRWQRHYGGLRVAVNLSAEELQDTTLIDDVRSALEESNLSPSCLELEVTETAAMTNVEDTIVKLSALKAMGVYLSIDDFGTGYSSLNYLKRLPLDSLKIDRSFVSDIQEDPEATPDDAVIVRAIVALGKSLRLAIVAEGVETEAQCRFLSDLACEHAQGYLFSRPVPAGELERLLEAAVVEAEC